MTLESCVTLAPHLSCATCLHQFDTAVHRPTPLACGHTVCLMCFCHLSPRNCPLDNTPISIEVVESRLPSAPQQPTVTDISLTLSNVMKTCVQELSAELRPYNASDSGDSVSGAQLSRPMQRKLAALVACPVESPHGDDRLRAVRAARSVGERAVTELILLHQDPHQLSSNLWAAVRARGCQFLGPAMQEEVLRLIVLALEDGSSLSRKVLVLFVVQRLETQYPHVSKTAIGHVVQLLYRASCFVVTKRNDESSLMQLREELRSVAALRRQHDSQLVQIASEAGLRISPEQWSSLLYGDAAHKSHMQSIIDKLQTKESFGQGITELTLILQKTGDPSNLGALADDFNLLANLPVEKGLPAPEESIVERTLAAVVRVNRALLSFARQSSARKQETWATKNPKYKTTLCRNVMKKGACPRGSACAFAHSNGELEKYQEKNKRARLVGAGRVLAPQDPAAALGAPLVYPMQHSPTPSWSRLPVRIPRVPQVTSSSLTAEDLVALQRVQESFRNKLIAAHTQALLPASSLQELDRKRRHVSSLSSGSEDDEGYTSADLDGRRSSDNSPPAPGFEAMYRLAAAASAAANNATAHTAHTSFPASTSGLFTWPLVMQQVPADQWLLSRQLGESGYLGADASSLGWALQGTSLTNNSSASSSLTHSSGASLGNTSKLSGSDVWGLPCPTLADLELVYGTHYRLF